MRYDPYEFKRDDAFDFARHIAADAKEHNDELLFKTCPYCKPKPTKGNTKTFSINLKTGQFKCLRDSCGVSGNMITLSRDFDFSLGNEIDEYYKPKKKFRMLPTPKEKVVPKESAIAYMESRGISEDITKRYEITTRNDNKNILVFPFYDENGKLQFVKYRKTDYEKSKDDNKEWCEKDCKPILFGMKQCNDKFDRLVICEGQLDSMSVSEAEIENAVSVPTGSKGFTWVPYCWNWVSKFDEIVIFGDHEKEHITLLDDIKNRFPNKIKHVREKDYMDCKDANEILIKHGKEQIIKCVENAVFLPVERVVQLSDVKSVNIYELEKLKTEIKELDSRLCGGLPFGMVCVLAGKRGEGKSTFASQLMAYAIEHGYSTFAYSGELPNYLYKAWFDFQIAGPNHIIENKNTQGEVTRFISNSNQALINSWYQDKAYIYDSSIIDSNESEDLLGCIRKVIMQCGVRVILIDNLMTAMYIDEEKGTDKYEKQGKFVRELTKIAIRYDVLIILVAHRRKNAYSGDANDEVSGSGDITALAGITLSYESGSEKEIEQGIMLPEQRKLVIAKNRLFGKTNFNGYILDYDERSKRIYGALDDANHQFGWDKSDGFITSDEPSPFS